MSQETAIEKAARTLLDFQESWKRATKEERKDLVRMMMIEKVGIPMAVKGVVWVKARPDFDVLIQLLKYLRVDEQRRFWIAYPEADKDICGTEEVMEEVRAGVKIAFPMSHNTLISVEGYIQ